METKRLPLASRPEPKAELQRGLSTTSALGLNVIDMVGVGPFVTLPLIVGAMGGPQAMLGWLLGALLSMCDGLIWSELGTAYPEAGGSYAYLKHLYGERKLGRVLLRWLFCIAVSWLSIVSCVGLVFWLGSRSCSSSSPDLHTSMLIKPLIFLPEPFI